MVCSCDRDICILPYRSTLLIGQPQPARPAYRELPAFNFSSTRFVQLDGNLSIAVRIIVLPLTIPGIPLEPRSLSDPISREIGIQW